MEKKFQLDPIIKRANTLFPNMPEDMRAPLQELLTDVKGKKGFGDMVVDQMLGWTSGKVNDIPLVGHVLSDLFDVRPFAYSHGISTLKTITAINKLGYRPSSTMFNAVGGYAHTWIKYGKEWIDKGNDSRKTPEMKQLLKDVEYKIGLQATFGGEIGVKREKLWQPLGLFQQVEVPNRERDFATAYTYATKKLGFSKGDATDFGIKSVHLNQFIYSTAAMPRLMRNPTGKLVLQFKSYLVNEMQYISSLRGSEIPKYATYMMVTGGPKAFVYFMKTLPLLGLLGFWDEIDKYMNQNAPQLSRGIPGLIGMDVTAQAVAQLPNTDIESLSGATLSDMAKLWKDVVKPTLQGEEKDLENVKDWATKVAPVLNYMNMFVESLSNKAGYVTDDRGRVKYQPTQYDKAKYLLGFKPSEQEIASFNKYYINKMETIQRNNRRQVIDRYLDAYTNGDAGKMVKELAKCREYGITSESIQSEAKKRGMSLENRLIMESPKALRQEVYDILKKNEK
jgi:hypothetical protein